MSTAVDELSTTFAALADPTRRAILTRLSAGEATVNQLAEPFALTQQAISKHIKVLADAGLVSQSKDAQRRPCHLEAEVFDHFGGVGHDLRVASEELGGDGVLVFVEVKIALGFFVFGAEDPVGGGEFSHDEAAASEVADEAAEDSIGDSGHGG